MGKGQGAGGVGGCGEWTKEEEVGTKTLLQLKSVSSVPEAAGLTGWHNLAERDGIRQSTGVWGRGGVGCGLGHPDQRLWSFGKAVSRGRDVERSGEGRLAGAQGLPLLGTRASDGGGCHSDGEASHGGSLAILYAPGALQAPVWGSGWASEGTDSFVS